MTLKEKILADLSQHPRSGEPVAYLDIYTKYQGVCSYEHSRWYMVSQGMKIPFYLDSLKALAEREEPTETPVKIGARFAEEQGQFRSGELRDYIFRHCETAGYSSHKHTLNVLVRTGKIEPMKKGYYRLVA